MQRENDRRYMKLAFEEALKGFGHVSPNPLVGAIIVKDGRVIGRGFHKKSGEAHAEVDAIENATENTEGATLYCNLEPCCHVKKKTPPCVPLIIKAGIKRVVISNIDPNPSVSGSGIRQLRESNIEVHLDILKEEGLRLNEIFFYHIKHNKIFINLKAAQTLDGKIQSLDGDSKWISNEMSRAYSHKLRLRYDAVLVGRKTLNNDNPRLDIRMGVESHNKKPYRVIVGDPREFKWESNILMTDVEKNIYIIGDADITKLNMKQKKVLSAGSVIQNKTIKQSLKDVYKLGVKSLLVEGGSKILSSFIEEELFNKITLFQAPILIGNGEGIYKSDLKKIKESVKLKIHNVELLGDNIKIELEKLCLLES